MLTLYYMSGSPFAWRVWLALEHKGLSCEVKRLSPQAGDLEAAAFRAMNPRARVPVLRHDDFALYESAAIVEYLEDRFPDKPRLLSSDLRRRALQRRMIREADQYFAEPMERLVEIILFTPQEKWPEERIDEARQRISGELLFWENAIAGEFLAGELSAVDFTLYPMLALVRRMALRRPGLEPALGSRLKAWADRFEALPAVQRTWPPHWRS